MDFSIMATWDGFMYFVILSLLEIVLGIDNILFISIISDKLPEKQRGRARTLGLVLALVARLGLLTVVSLIMASTEPLFTIFNVDFSAQSIVLLLGGLFLIYKATKEMHHSISGHEEKQSNKKVSFSSVIMQIVMVDLVFSFDAVISAIGMTNELGEKSGKDPMIIIYLAVIVSMIVMLLFAKPIAEFISKRPSIKNLALSFLVVIGVILVAEAFGEHVPKGYVYFALVYSFVVEMLNLRMDKNRAKKRAKKELNDASGS